MKKIGSNAFLVLGIGLLLVLFGCTSPNNGSSNTGIQEVKNFPFVTSTSCTTVKDCTAAYEYDKYWCSGCKIVCSSDNLCEYQSLSSTSNPPANTSPPTEDTTNCKSIADERDKGYCYINAAEDTENIALCDFITDSYYKAECQSDVGIKKGDIAICSQIQDNEWKYDCYSYIAVNKKDTSLCSNVPSQNYDNGGNIRNYRDSCLGLVAETVKDPTICTQITLQNLKDYCTQRSQPK